MDMCLNVQKKRKNYLTLIIFEQYLFKATHTYTPSLFEKEFILPKEHEEGINIENF